MRRAWLLSFVVLSGLPSAAWPQGGESPRPRVPREHLHVGHPTVSVYRIRFLRQLRRRLGQQLAGRLGPRDLRPTLRRLRRAARSRVPGQHLHDELSGIRAGRLGRFWQLRRRLEQLRDGRASSESSASATAAPAAPLGPEFRVNTYTTAVQAFRPWPRTPPATSSSSGRARRTGRAAASSASATPPPARPSAPSSASTPTRRTIRQYAAVASDASGNFVVVWQSGGAGRLQLRRLRPALRRSGAPLGPEFRVNTYTTGIQSRAVRGLRRRRQLRRRLAQLRPGRLAGGIFGQRYASSGAPLGPEFRVNTYTTDAQYRPSVAADPSGNFVVVWMGSLQDGSRLRRLRPALRQLRRPARPGVPCQHLYDGPPVRPGRGLGRLRQLRRRLAKLPAGRLQPRRLVSWTVSASPSHTATVANRPIGLFVFSAVV